MSIDDKMVKLIRKLVKLEILVVNDVELFEDSMYLEMELVNLLDLSNKKNLSKLMIAM
jgi:hypothetical protein